MRKAIPYFLFSICIFGIRTLSSAQENTIALDTIQDHFKNHYSAEFFENKYYNYTLEHFVDNYYPNAHYQIETTGNFSQPDQYTFSITGYSFKWNRFYYDGVRINDLSMPGASLHKPMLYDLDLKFDLVESRIEFESRISDKKYVTTQYNHGSLGDRVPWTDWYVNLMHGHKSGPEKQLRPINRRRKTGAAGRVYFNLPSEKHNNYGYITAGRRFFTDFDFIEIDDYYNEKYIQLHYHGDFYINDRQFDYLITYNNRDHLNSEFFFGKEATASLSNLNLSLYNTDLTIGSETPMKINSVLNFSHKSIKKDNANFNRNVADQDGESLEPFYPDGKFNDLILGINGRKELKKNLSFVFDTYNGLVQFSPENESFRNSIYYENNLSPFTSLYTTEWQSQSFSAAVLENTFGLMYSNDQGKSPINVQAKFNLTYDALLFDPSSISTVNYELGLRIEKSMGSKARSRIDIGKRRVPYEFDLVKFLSNNYQSGQSYFWNDQNSNRSFQANEQGSLFTTTGGSYHSASDDLKQQEIYYLDYSTKWITGRNWQLNLLAQYRKFANQWTVEFDQEPTEIGAFVNSQDGQEVFFFNGGQEVNYNVVPFNEQLFESLAETELGWLFNSPFYGGVTLSLEKKNPKTYFYISATAYAVVGLSPMGNGVLTNNLNVLSESLANPNTYIQNLGRLDSDRAYIVRIYFNQNLGKKWNLGFQVKYKDGQPVNRNVFETRSSPLGNQFAFWNIDIKGINPFTGQFGVREAGFWNYEIKLNYNFQISDHPATLDLNIYNIMDVAVPLNNYNFPEPDGQFALDFQIPRGALLSFKYSF